MLTGNGMLSKNATPGRKKMGGLFVSMDGNKRAVG